MDNIDYDFQAARLIIFNLALAKELSMFITAASEPYLLFVRRRSALATDLLGLPDDLETRQALLNALRKALQVSALR